MKKQVISWVAVMGSMALMFAQTTSAFAHGDDGSCYIPNDHRPLLLKSGNLHHHGKRRVAGKKSHGRIALPLQQAALICPVTGDKIASVKDAVGQSTYQGKTYYFCCAECKPRFDKNPAQIAKNAAAGKFEKM